MECWYERGVEASLKHGSESDWNDLKNKNKHADHDIYAIFY